MSDTRLLDTFNDGTFGVPEVGFSVSKSANKFDSSPLLKKYFFSQD